jgi:hypothetical protein
MYLSKFKLINAQKYLELQHRGLEELFDGNKSGRKSLEAIPCGEFLQVLLGE